MGEYFIGIDQIRNRISCLNESKSNNIYGINIKSSYNKLMSEKTTNTNLKQVMDICLENWSLLGGNSNESFEMIIEAFDRFCDSNYATSSLITNYSNIISEAVVPKVRDGKQAQSYIKRKLGQLKVKISTNIKNNIEKASNAVNNSIKGAKTNFNNNTNNIKNNIDKSLSSVKKEGFDKILRSTDIIVNCDRVLENYNRVSKRFNVDKLLYESIDTQDFITEYSRLIDTYNLNNSAKMIITFETALYIMNKNHAIFENKDILKYTTDYFLSKEDCDIKDAKYALSSTLFYDPKRGDMDDIQYITEFDPEKKKKEEKTVTENSYYLFDIESILEDNKIDKEKMKKNAKDIFNKFKALPNKTVEGFKTAIKRMYSSSDTMIIEEVPNLLSYIRTIFVAGTGFAINPVVGIVILIADQAIALTIKRKETEKMLNQYNKEKEKAKKKLEKCKSDEQKERYKKYIEGLDKSIDKLEEYYKNLLSDEENDKREEEKYSKDNDNDFDFDFNLDDDEWKVESIFTPIYGLVKYITESDVYDILNKLDESVIYKMSYDSIDALTEFVSKYSNNNDNTFIYKSILENARNESRLNSKYIMVDCLNENIDLIKKSKGQPINSLDQAFIYAECVQSIQDIYNATKLRVLDESSFTNSLVIASEKLRKSMLKMTDTEKNVSKNIDVSVNNIRKAAERAMTNDNREAIIKGSILPSASKILKMTLTSGIISALVSPVVAVIGILGYIGCSAKMKSKERQMVLDEIEIELKMVERYLKVAEEKNDLKAQRDLLKTQRELERQHQRIKYKMKIEFDQNVPEVKANDED